MHGSTRVAFKTLGCKVNRVESDQIAQELIGEGVHVVADADSADVVVINTCTVTGEADAKARKAVRHALRADLEPVVVVTGCLASIDAAGVAGLGKRVVVESDKRAVASAVRRALAGREADQSPHARRLVDGGKTVAEEPEPDAGTLVAGDDGFRTRAVIKVEDGCDNFCSYCIIPYARGNPRGVDLALIESQAAALVASGVREIVLTGINIGRYSDPQTGADLARVVEVVAQTGVPRIRLSSIEPPDLTERFLSTLASTPAVCEHLHVPLQSGSDAVLSAMNRAYTAEQYVALIEAARAALPGLAVTTDVIAGFPLESEDDHRATVALLESIGFSKLHVFRYSAREGTPAASMPPVDAPTIARRAHELRAVGDASAARYAAAVADREVELLVERIEGDVARGTTREYLKARCPAQGCGIGDVVRTVLDLDTQDKDSD